MFVTWPLGWIIGLHKWVLDYTNECRTMCQQIYKSTNGTLQGVLSFPVINCTDFQGIEIFDGVQIVKSLVSFSDRTRISWWGLLLSALGNRDGELLIAVSQIEYTVTTIHNSSVPLKEISSQQTTYRQITHHSELACNGECIQWHWESSSAYNVQGSTSGTKSCRARNSYVTG